jgi:hypothetical protein
VASPEQFRDVTSRLFLAQLTGDRFPFLGAQRRAPTRQSSQDRINSRE